MLLMADGELALERRLPDRKKLTKSEARKNPDLFYGQPKTVCSHPSGRKLNKCYTVAQGS